MIKVLITGVRGFLGSNMAKYLSKKKDMMVYGTNGDLRYWSSASEETKGMDYVFHFAANMGGVGYFSKHNYYPPIDNFLIDLNMLLACETNNVKRVFYPSSACIYPLTIMNTGVPLIEEMIDGLAEPDQMYGWEKLTLTKLIRNSPIDVRVGILHTIYGEGQEYKGEKAKFPPQIAYKAIQAKKTKSIEVWGNGKQTRTFLYVKDAIERIYKVMMSDKYNGPVNIGSDVEVSVNDIVKICCDIVKIKPEIFHDLNKPTGPERRICSNEKFYSLYGRMKETDLKSGFKKIINYITKKDVKTL